MHHKKNRIKDASPKQQNFLSALVQFREENSRNSYLSLDILHVTELLLKFHK